MKTFDILIYIKEIHEISLNNCLDVIQGGGRQKYSDRRDRLLQILSRKKKARSSSAMSSSGSSVNTNVSASQGPSSASASRGRELPMGGQNIDKIMDFIEGNQLDEAKHAKKAAKKARQKQKKVLMFVWCSSLSLSLSLSLSTVS